MNQEEMNELELLREEKRVRLQQERAAAALKEAGVPLTFASLLAGKDDSDTDQRSAGFCAAFQEAISQSIREHLPQTPPQMTSPNRPSRPRRGVQRL